MANERYISWLIDDGEVPPVGAGSLTRTLLTGAMLTVVGAIVVWALFLLLATA